MALLPRVRPAKKELVMRKEIRAMETTKSHNGDKKRGRNIAAAFVVVAVAVAGVSLARWSPVEATPELQGIDGDLLADSRSGNIKHSAFGEGHLVHHDELSGAVQMIAYGSSLNPSEPNWLRIRNYPFLVGSPHDEEFFFSAPFDVIDVAPKPKKRDFFYVLGQSGAEFIIQRWKRKPVTTGGFGGPPAGGYLMLRTEVFRGTNLGEIKRIVADHQSRSLLIVHGDPLEISRMSLPDAVVTHLTGIKQFPELEDWRGGVVAARHYNASILFTLGVIPNFLVGEDIDDDSHIDQWFVLDHDTYHILYGRSQIIDDFKTNQ